MTHNLLLLRNAGGDVSYETLRRKESHGMTREVVCCMAMQQLLRRDAAIALSRRSNQVVTTKQTIYYDAANKLLRKANKKGVSEFVQTRLNMTDKSVCSVKSFAIPSQTDIDLSQMKSC